MVRWCMCEGERKGGSKVNGCLCVWAEGREIEIQTLVIWCTSGWAEGWQTEKDKSEWVFMCVVCIGWETRKWGVYCGLCESWRVKRHRGKRMRWITRTDRCLLGCDCGQEGEREGERMRGRKKDKERGSAWWWWRREFWQLRRGTQTTHSSPSSHS